MKNILVTGGSGFIGFHLLNKLKSLGYNVRGFDNFNDYYDVDLKKAREKELLKNNIMIENVDLLDPHSLNKTIKWYQPDIVIHLAAHAGVRHSMKHKMSYIMNNIVGTQNLIEACEKNNVQRVVYASTSCVMAGNSLPWKEDEPTGHQLNPYGYTKRTNECQFKVSNIPYTTGLRFFTVYGPWGRPDMALFTFTRQILNDEEIHIFNHGDMKRDFTYVDDIVNGINLVVKEIENLDAPRHEIYNIGNGRQVDLMHFVQQIEKQLGKEAKKLFLPKHPADTKETWSDTTKLQKLGYKSETPIELGAENFINWYKSYYGEK